MDVDSLRKLLIGLLGIMITGAAGAYVRFEVMATNVARLERTLDETRGDVKTLQADFTRFRLDQSETNSLLRDLKRRESRDRDRGVGG